MNNHKEKIDETLGRKPVGPNNFNGIGNGMIVMRPVRSGKKRNRRNFVMKRKR